MGYVVAGGRGGGVHRVQRKLWCQVPVVAGVVGGWGYIIPRAQRKLRCQVPVLVGGVGISRESCGAKCLCWRVG